MTRPNILMVIADDQSFPHASTYGCRFVNTPAFDRVAHDGILFMNAFCAAPMCSPARAVALTGLNMWRLEEASLLAGIFPSKFHVYPDLLEDNGYAVGFTGKGWAPGNVEESGRCRNPAGPEYNDLKNPTPSSQQTGIDYAGNFMDFLSKREGDQPFCFWFGPHEPHRPYEKGSGLRSGRRLADVQTPPYVPDTDEVRSDFLDYALEIEWYDMHLGRILDHLDDIGELDNTVVVVTADNGMPFPRAKANLYTDSCHVPFAVCWKARCPGNRIVTDFVSFSDLAPTFLDAAGIDAHIDFSGQSLLPLIESEASGRIDPARDHVLTGRERHIHCRPGSVGYPVRSIRTDAYHYVRNYAPERWPVGDPISLYGDTDAGPTKQYMMDHRQEEHVRELFRLAFEKRPAEELYSIQADPYCLHNLADQAQYDEIRQALSVRLEQALRSEEDPRVLGFGELFDSYPYFQGPWPWHDDLPGFKDIGHYNHEAQQRVDRIKVDLRMKECKTQ